MTAPDDATRIVARKIAEDLVRHGFISAPGVRVDGLKEVPPGGGVLALILKVAETRLRGADMFEVLEVADNLGFDLDETDAELIESLVQGIRFTPPPHADPLPTPGADIDTAPLLEEFWRRHR